MDKVQITDKASIKLLFVSARKVQPDIDKLIVIKAGWW